MIYHCRVIISSNNEKFSNNVDSIEKEEFITSLKKLSLLVHKKIKKKYKIECDKINFFYKNKKVTHISQIEDRHYNIDIIINHQAKTEIEHFIKKSKTGKRNKIVL